MTRQITQDQLDEIQLLLDTKNIRIMELEAELSQYNPNIANTVDVLQSRVKYLEEDIVKMRLEFNDEEFKHIACIAEKDMLHQQNIILNRKNNQLEIDLSIEKSLTKSAIKLLNELKVSSTSLEPADLSNILDVTA